MALKGKYTYFKRDKKGGTRGTWNEAMREPGEFLQVFPKRVGENYVNEEVVT